ncbi:CCR4 [Candida pseudojiufengensis]|uniref:CCR4 n=1 Tax=Candida pseudojiufengensis TaxID=497109 RepID=UPI0022245659|nr:CCR4 [Candida pseudojiufengensis]KAI5963654.1 CCR4 [Candida pseudojiufengensis]
MNMNLASKYQVQGQGQPQSNLQAQQILLQQLHQGQSLSQQNQQQNTTSNSLGAGFQPNESYNNDNQNLYQNYQRNQLQQQQQQQQQQQYFPQFQPQNQSANNHINSSLQQQPQPQQLSRQLPHIQQQQFYNQQALKSQQVQQQIQLQSAQIPTPMQKSTTSVEQPNSIHWQHQQQLCQVSRSSSVPHYYARQFASNSRKNPYDSKSVGLIEATKVILSKIEEQKINDSTTTNSALLHNKKTTQDDELMEEQRMRLKTQGRQLWCQLDLSGQGLVSISPKLFHYDFLESLYLNNNKITQIPSEISKLRSLRTLDLSHNRISELPYELGLCFNLRYLYLFDNNIKNFPTSFGNLIELLFLGVEGNPLDGNVANIIAEKGTKELIAAIRDQKTTRTPEPREWLTIEDGEVVESNVYKAEKSPSDSFTVLSYNTLCQHYATPRMYKYTPSWALQWDYRRAALEKEILNYSTDVICMQEVETKTYQDFWAPLLAQRGYKGLFYNKTRSKTMSENDAKKVDGCAFFYKIDKFTLVHKQNFEYNSVCMGSDKYKKTKDLFNRFMNKDNIALILYLQHKETDEKICFVNTHLHWDPAFNDVKALQIGILLEELQGLIKKYQHASSIEEVKNASIIVCGDFNSVKKSAVYQMFSTGSSKNHDDLSGRDYGKFTESGFHHPFKLKSAYESLGELPFTNLTPAFTDNIDYIWYSTSNLQIKGLLGKVDENYASNSIGFPDANFPSDHVPILAKFQIKKTNKT